MAKASPLQDGGPAFPHPVDVDRSANGVWETHAPHPGMSLRDWFAGKALAGLSSLQLDQLGADDIAKMTYQQADAMLAARVRQDGKEGAC